MRSKNNGQNNGHPYIYIYMSFINPYGLEWWGNGDLIVPHSSPPMIPSRYTEVFLIKKVREDEDGKTWRTFEAIKPQ